MSSGMIVEGVSIHSHIAFGRFSPEFGGICPENFPVRQPIRGFCMYGPPLEVGLLARVAIFAEGVLRPYPNAQSETDLLYSPHMHAKWLDLPCDGHLYGYRGVRSQASSSLTARFIMSPLLLVNFVRTAGVTLIPESTILTYMICEVRCQMTVRGVSKHACCRFLLSVYNK